LLLSTVEPADIKGKRIAVLPFSSGCTMSYWGAIVKGDTTEIRTKLDLNCLARMKIVLCKELSLSMRVVLELLHLVPHH